MNAKTTEKSFVLAIIACLVSPAAAELFIYEPFEYDPTAGINNGAWFGNGAQAGGLGLGTWEQLSNGSAVIAQNEGDVADEGVEFSDSSGNVLPVAGNAYERRNRVGQVAVNSPIDPAATTALTADNSTLWMTFLFEDFGFSGPDFGIGLHSEKMIGNDNQTLGAPGFGVGFGINSTGGPARNIATIVYDNSAEFTRQTEATATFDGPTASEVFLLAMKVNWNPSGTPDEIFVFIIDDITAEPNEADALATDTFDWDLATQQSLDVFNFSDTQVGYVDEIRVGTSFGDVVGSPGPKSFPVEIAENAQGFELSWTSKPGMLYNIRSSPDPFAELATWTLVEGDIPASPDTNTKTIARPDAPALFYRVEEFPKPPATIYSENFDGSPELPAGWTTGANPADTGTTVWELGAPAGGGSAPPTANSGSNCVGTNLTANHGITSDIWLRSPGTINLNTATGATVLFHHWVDMDDFDLGDTGMVRVLDAADLPGTVTELAVVKANIQGLAPAGWVLFSAKLPDTVLGKTVALEFRFASDAVAAVAASGWYIDDVAVTAQAP
ncbi:MAG: choice-of-anchor J domain-containing protein [Verrucomicrobiales bacterium]|nr:choice-of-anchor J domain-containing protein [Verrucomicrobiales bacterium]